MRTQILLAIEIGWRVELVFVDVAEQVLVFFRTLLFDLREARIAAPPRQIDARGTSLGQLHHVIGSWHDRPLWLVLPRRPVR